EWERAALGLDGLRDLFDGGALDPFEDQVEKATVLTEVEDLSDVGVLDTCEYSRFVEEHATKAIVRRALGEDRLQSDLVAESVLAGEAGEPHGSHPADGYGFEDRVPIELASWRERRSEHRLKNTMPVRRRRSQWDPRTLPRS